MATVNVMDGIRYGFGLLGYIIVVGIVGAILIAIGGALAQGGGAMALIGGLIALIGALSLYAGMLGIGYKVIADGVHTGTS